MGIKRIYAEISGMLCNRWVMGLLIVSTLIVSAFLGTFRKIGFVQSVFTVLLVYAGISMLLWGISKTGIFSKK